MLNPELNPRNALIFRITHVENIPHILAHGLHCRNSPTQNPDFVQIGDKKLIENRRWESIPIRPYGVPSSRLSNYIPFYFTPFSPMMYKIYRGSGTVQHVPNSKLAILVTSIRELAEKQAKFVFSDRHVSNKTRRRRFFSSCDDLDKIDWEILQDRDFMKDPSNPEKTYRYQAEALVYKCLPINLLLGIACYNLHTQGQLADYCTKAGVSLKVRREWYFDD